MSRLRRVGLALSLAVLVMALLFWRFGRQRGERGQVASDRASAGAGASNWKLSPGERAAPALVRDGSLAGTVVDPKGQPIGNANVCARGSDDDLTDDLNSEPACATSRRDGVYEITGLFPADYNVDASAPGHQAGRYRAQKRESVRLAPGEKRTGIDLVLDAGGVELRGRVRDLGGGPIAFARVLVRTGGGMWRGNEGPVARTKADERGEFRVFVAAGTASLEASAPGYAAGSKSAIVPGSFVEVLLTPESVLVGRVIRVGSGEPVAGARVDATPNDFSGEGRSATTDAEGKFRIDRLGPGRYKPTARTIDGIGKAAASVLLGVGSRSSEVVIEMHPAVSVSGKVFLADGKSPCPRGTFYLRSPKTEERESGSLATSGDFLLKGVLPGKYDVYVYCEGQSYDPDIPPLQVGNKSLTGLRYVVQGGQRVRGRVVHSDGSGSKETTVVMRSGDNPRDQKSVGEETRQDGSFEFEGVRPGVYNVTVYASAAEPTLEPPRVLVVAGRDVDDVRIVLPSVYSLTGTVVDEDGQPIKQASVYAQATDGGMWNETMSRDDGTFTMEGLREGSHGLFVYANQAYLRAPGMTDATFRTTKVTVKAGGTRPVRLVVERSSGAITGVVIQGGQPVTDAFVDADRESDSPAASASGTRRNLRGGWDRRPSLTDGDGRFEITGLSPGKYSVRAFRKGGGDAIAEHVEVNMRATVSLVIAPTGGLSGTVTLSSGGTPESFTLNVEDVASGFSLTERFWRTGGRWSLTDLPAGRFQVGARSPEATGDLSVALAEGQSRKDLVIPLVAKARVRGRIVALDDSAPVPGMMITVAGAGESAMVYSSMSSKDKRNITDAEGRFEVDDVSAGKVRVVAMPQDWQRATCGWVRFRAELKAGGDNDLGMLRCARRKLKGFARRGDLGFETKEEEPDVNDPPMVLTVAVIRGDGPAASSGLKVGDVIVSVDGRDVTGLNDYLYGELVDVAAGTNVSLGLKRGGTVSIKAGEPR